MYVSVATVTISEFIMETLVLFFASCFHFLFILFLPSANTLAGGETKPPILKTVVSKTCLAVLDYKND